MYWWQSLNPLRKLGMKGQAILHCDSTGCQAMHDFKWMGKVVGFERGTIYNGRDTPCEYIVIEILIHNHAYSDARDGKEPELYKYPLVNADIQNVKGVWVLFT
jgi:hypothetical protein